MAEVARRSHDRRARRARRRASPKMARSFRALFPASGRVVRIEGRRAELVEILDPAPERAEPIVPGSDVAAAAQRSTCRTRSTANGSAASLSRLSRAPESTLLSDPWSTRMAQAGGGRPFTPAFPITPPTKSASCAPARTTSSRSTIARCLPRHGRRGRGGAGALGRSERTGKPLDIGVTATLEGLDVDLRGSGPLELAETRKLTRTADALDLARLSNHGAVIVERRPPRVAFGEALVKLPPGGFLQATEAGEALLADVRRKALADAKQVADLFCGAGAFALRLARHHEVFAADSDEAAIDALERGAAATQGLASSPPRRAIFCGGRSARTSLLDSAARSSIPRARARKSRRASLRRARCRWSSSISCNAASFARDALILIDGGYSMETVTPLDQFRFSPHVEIAAVFRRRKRKAARAEAPRVNATTRTRRWPHWRTSSGRAI